MALPNMTEILAQIQPEFIRSRYPYTYAYDLLREHPDLVPAAVENRVISRDGAPNPASRAGVAKLVEVWAEMEGVDDTEICVPLADAYLVTQGIIRP